MCIVSLFLLRWPCNRIKYACPVYVKVIVFVMSLSNDSFVTVYYVCYFISGGELNLEKTNEFFKHTKWNSGNIKLTFITLIYILFIRLILAYIM